MKIIILILLTNISVSHSQVINKPFYEQVKYIVKEVKKNLSLKEDDYTKKSEYYLFDLTLDENGSIKDIEIIRRDSSYNIEKIRTIIPAIKKNWLPRKSSYSKVYIPLILTFEELDSEGEITDRFGVFGIADFFKYLKNKSKKIYVSESIHIHFSSKKI
jgi:hypothetical protein